MLDRRRFMAAAAAAPAALAMPGIARADSTASRTFRVLRAGDEIGSHSLRATRSGDTITVDIVIDLVVTVLAIPAYRYELANREVWQGGQILSVDSRVNDDGEAHFSRIRRDGDRLTVEGSEYAGPAPIDGVTTSYWVAEFLTRRPWISTQTGRPLAIDIANAGAQTAPGGIAATRWNVTGDFETSLLYDGAGEWVGCEFDAGDEPGTYEMVSTSGRFTDLWAAAS